MFEIAYMKINLAPILILYRTFHTSCNTLDDSSLFFSGHASLLFLHHDSQDNQEQWVAVSVLKREYKGQFTEAALPVTRISRIGRKAQPWGAKQDCCQGVHWRRKWNLWHSQALTHPHSSNFCHGVPQNSFALTGPPCEHVKGITPDVQGWCSAGCLPH